MAELSDLETVQLMRERMEEMTADGLQYLGRCPPDLTETTIEVPIPDGTSQRTIIVSPVAEKGTPARYPLVILLHGGGFAFGSPESALSPARGYASLIGAIVACPSYKYTPEHPFPASIHSAWEVTSWLSQSDNIQTALGGDGGHVEFDPSLGLVIGGISAGANLAAVIAGISAATTAATSAGLTKGLSSLAQPFQGVFLSVPLLVHEHMDLPAEYKELWKSRTGNEETMALNAKSIEEVQTRLKADLDSPWWSPLNHDLAKLAGHHAPRVYIQAGENDLLRDDAVVYERALRDHGIAETKLDVIKGVEHAGWCTFPLDDCHTTEMRIKSLDGMSWLLGKNWDTSDWGKNKRLPY